MLAPPRPDPRPRKPPPRHALEPTRPGDHTTLILVLLLVLTSGFVAGTTATFNARTRNPSNTFATAALSVPTNLSLTPSGSDVVVAWTNVTGTNNTGAGYKISFFDRGAGTTTAGLPSACPTSGYTEVGSIAGQPFTDTNLTAAPHTNYADGRFWCYEVKTAYPCCPVPANAWTSQGANPVTSVRLGNTFASITINGDLDGTLEAGEYIDITFNQPIDTATQPPAGSTVCTNSREDSIYFGMSGTANNSCNKTETLSGVRLRSATDITSERRYDMTTSWPGCATPATTGCTTMRLTVGSITAGALVNVGSNTWTIAGTANTNFLDTFTGARDFCPTGASSGTPLVRDDPAAGRCQITAGSTF